MDNEIVLVSNKEGVSSLKDPIIIRDNNQFRILLDSVKIINNSHNPDCCVSVSIVVERKLKTKEGLEPIQPSRLKVGEFYRTNLKSEELSSLYHCLGSLYASFGPSDAGRERTYVSFDGTPESVKKFFKSDGGFFQLSIKDSQTLVGWNSLVSAFSEIICDLPNENSSLIKLLSQLDLKSQKSINSLLEYLSTSSDFEDGLNLADSTFAFRLRSLINIAQIRHAKVIITNHLDCSDEKKWQQYFKDNKWILEQLFLTKYCYFIDELETGIPGIDGKGSNTVDFAFRNNLSRELSIVEIKPPTCQLIKGNEPYRNGVYKINQEVLYATSQVLQNKYNLVKEYNSKVQQIDEGNKYYVFDPICILLIGTYNGLSTDSNTKTQEDQKRTFDLFRRCLHGIQIVTYDELLSRIDVTLELLSSDINKNDWKM